MDISSDNFSQFEGNHAQQYLHKEIVDTVNETSNFFSSNIGNQHIESISNVIYYSANEAIEYNKAHEIERGFILSDFCSTMLDLGKKVTLIMAKGIDIGLMVTEASAKGVALGTLDTAEFAGNTFIHPIDTTINTCKIVGKIGQLLGKASCLLGKAALLFVTNPDELNKKIDNHLENFVNKVKIVAPQVWEAIKEDPEGAITKTAAFATSFLLTKKVPTFQSFVDKFSTILKSNITKHPLKEASKITKVAAKCGIKNTKSALKVIQKTPPLAKDHQQSLLAQALAEFNYKFPNFKHVNWKHVFCGEKNKRSLKGFHHATNYPERIVEIVKQPNKYGVYQAIYECSEKRKFSTFFPDSWNRAKLIKKVKEAFQNPITQQKQLNGFVGSTKEGMPIQFWFKKDKNNKIILDSIYPYLTKVK